MKNRNKLLGALLTLAVIVTGSLAIFSDSKSQTMEGAAGTVQLGEVAKPSVNLANMKPGEKREFTLESVYSGSLDAVGKVVVTDKGTGNGKMKNSGTEGFVIKNAAGQIIQFSGASGTVNLGDVKSGGKLTQKFTVELLSGTPDTYQGAKVDLEFVFTATQK